MGIRLNKFISETGICSRREADKYIEEGRVTVNGRQPSTGQQVTLEDVVQLDEVDLKLSRNKFASLEAAQEKTRQETAKKKPFASAVRKRSENDAPHEKFGKYNKYAAARRAAKNGGFKKEVKEEYTKAEEMELLVTRMSKNLSRSKLAQRIVAAPKSAALRKNSRNNPVNKAKRQAERRARNNNNEE